MALEWLQNGIWEAAQVFQGEAVRVRGASACNMMRQEGVKGASGRRHKNSAS